jgi:hypothetical protein
LGLRDFSDGGWAALRGPPSTKSTSESKYDIIPPNLQEKTGGDHPPVFHVQSAR